MALTILDLQKTDFAHSYQWDILFPSYGDILFVASISDATVDVTISTIEHGAGSYSYPSSAGRGALSFQIYEVHDWKVIQWLEDWAKLICPDFNLVALIGEPNIARPVYIYNLDYDQSIKYKEEYLVIPSGEVVVEKGSEKGGAVTLSLNVVIVGTP